MTANHHVPKVRRITFEYPEGMAPIWTPRRPEFSCAANSVSLMMPTIEPFFVRSARQAMQDGEQQGLGAQDMEAARHYIGQESQHHAQHVRFNRMLYRRYPRVATLDRAIGRVYRAAERRGSARFNAGFAAASETMAYSAARWAAGRRNELFDGADDVVSTLFLWHLAEEVEHKSVAYDLYWNTYGQRSGARRCYLRAMIVALLLMVFFVIAGTTMMLISERRIFHPLAWVRLTGWAVMFAFELLSNLVISLFPGHHPDNFTDPLWYEVWLQEFDHNTGTMPLWHDSATSGETEPVGMLP